MFRTNQPNSKKIINKFVINYKNNVDKLYFLCKKKNWIWVRQTGFWLINKAQIRVLIIMLYKTLFNSVCYGTDPYIYSSLSILFTYTILFNSGFDNTLSIENRHCLDCMCSYHNSNNWVRSAVTAVGHGPDWMDSWSSCDGSILFCYLQNFFSSCSLLSLWRPSFRREKLYLYGCCSL